MAAIMAVDIKAMAITTKGIMGMAITAATTAKNMAAITKTTTIVATTTTAAAATEATTAPIMATVMATMITGIPTKALSVNYTVCPKQ
jgi:hypothetical protein